MTTTKDKLAALGYELKGKAFYKSPTSRYVIYWAGVVGVRIDADGKLHHDRRGAFPTCGA